MRCIQCSLVKTATGIRNGAATNLEKSGNLTVVREKLGKVGKVWENVFCLWCVTATAMVTE